MRMLIIWCVCVVGMVFAQGCACHVGTRHAQDNNQFPIKGGIGQ